jgi:hypothetical protein
MLLSMTSQQTQIKLIELVLTYYLGIELWCLTPLSTIFSDIIQGNLAFSCPRFFCVFILMLYSHLSSNGHDRRVV